MEMATDIIVSTPNGRPAKNDIYLQELINAQNWKQALASIEKRLKKEKSDRLLLNKALVLCYMPGNDTHDLGISFIKELLKRDAFTSDVESCRAIEGIASTTGFETLLPKASDMWNKALKARPGDEELSNEIFDLKFLVKDYGAAQKVAQACMKSRRDWYFRYILCVHLQATARSSKHPPKFKSMLGELAVKSLAMSADAVIPDPDFIESPEKYPDTNGCARIKNPDPSRKALETSRQLEFLIEVYRQHGKHEQALAILDDDLRTGLRSSLGNIWDLVLDKIELLTICEKLEELSNFCEALLRDAYLAISNEDGKPSFRHGKRGNDWVVWRALIYATTMIGNPHQYLKSADLVSLYSKLDDRNSQLACMELHLCMEVKGLLDKEQSVSYLIGYFDRYHLKGILFKDLAMAAALTAASQKALLDHAHSKAHTFAEDSSNSQSTRRAWLYSEINSLKLDYYLVVSLEKNRSKKGLLGAFVANCLRLYRLSLMEVVANEEEEGPDMVEVDRNPTDRHVGDDAAILAIQALVHLWFAGQKTALLRATLIAERALELSKHNYHIQLLVIRLYLYQGMTSRAAEVYSHLSIKNIQYETSAWILYTRISTIHPHSTQKTGYHPLQDLKKMCNFLSSIDKSTRSATIKSMREGSLRNLLKTIDLFEFPTRSLPRTVLDVERDELQSALRPDYQATWAASRYFDDPRDPRDARSFANFEANGQVTIEELLRPGPLPQVPWLRMQAQLVYIRTWLAGIAPSSGEAFEFTWTGQEPSVKGPGVEIKADDMTAAEDKGAKLLFKTFLMLKATCLAQRDPNYSHKLALLESWVRSLEEFVTSFHSQLRPILNKLRDGQAWYSMLTWETFHNVLSFATFLRVFFSVFCSVAILEDMLQVDVGHGKGYMSKNLQRITELALGVFRTLVADAKELQDALKTQPTVVDMLVRDILGAKTDKDGSEEGFVDADEAEIAGELYPPREADDNLMDARYFALRVVENYVDALTGIVDLKDVWLKAFLEEE